VLAALLLSLVGHSSEEIANDYVLTRIGVETHRVELTNNLKMWLGDDAMTQDGVFELSSTSIDVMNSFLEFVESKYGGFVGYCKDFLKLEEKDLDRIRLNIGVQS
jgi:protein tyrosine/serine phosphatase